MIGVEGIGIGARLQQQLDHRYVPPHRRDPEHGSSGGSTDFL